MKILAVDTSSKVAAVAVVEDGALLGEYILNHKMFHSKKLMPMVAEVMGSLELGPKDVDVYAVSTGPGSFTGLRIGVTTVKAIAYAAEKPVAGIPTLDALAYNIPLTGHVICPMMDARNDQVYTALYRWERGMQVKLTEYMGIHVSELVELVKGRGQKAVFLGDGAMLHENYLKRQLAEACELAPASLMLQKASSVALLALYRASIGKLESCYDIVPFYLRKPQAEREFGKGKCGD